MLARKFLILVAIGNETALVRALTPRKMAEVPVRRQHLCSLCQNHNVQVRRAAGHRHVCPWKECLCHLCAQTRRRNELARGYRRERDAARRDRPAENPGENHPVPANGNRLGVPAVNLIAVANAAEVRPIQSLTAARAGIFFVFLTLYVLKAKNRSRLSTNVYIFIN